MKQILTVNCGSSSVKLALFNLQQGDTNKSDEIDLELVERLLMERVTDHTTSINDGIKRLKNFNRNELIAIGHRVVHGGAFFSQATLINEEVAQKIEQCIEFAPLHNPANLAGINACLKMFDVPQAAIFDTAFHATMPAKAYRYALPKQVTEQFSIRRYGFHGTSHAYVAQKTAAHLNRPLSECNFITLHLGNGASACAIAKGQSVDTTMGFTPLEGLVMGTRCGDIDPALFGILQDKLNKSADEIDYLLNKQSGLKGLAGANDMRDLLSRDDDDAKLAVEVFCYKIRKTIGAYMATLAEHGGTDGIIFTAGIGENSTAIRQKCLEPLAPLGIAIDQPANDNAGKSIKTVAAHSITTPDSPVSAWVVATNEALMIAKQAHALIE